MSDPAADHAVDLSGADFDGLLREVLARVEGVLDEQERLRLLLDAVVSMAADLDLDSVLARIVSIASALVDATYAALGVIGRSRDRPLRTFIHHGITPGQMAEIGELPTGHGLLGLIIERPEPLRLHDIASHPASYGFPPNHPPMSSFLGVPVRIRDRVFGNLYLTEKVGGGDFTEQDERVVVALAAAAGVAIENAHLAEEATRREHWLAATAEITRLLVKAETGPDALQAVADLSREVAEADVSWIVAGADVDQLTLRVVSGAEADPEKMHALHLVRSLAGDVVRSGEPLSVDDLGSDPRAVDLSAVLGWERLGPTMMVPLGSGSGIEGVLALAWSPERRDVFHVVDAELPASFAEQAALALQVARARQDQTRLELFQDRDRIGRDLHDLVIQRLFAVGLGLQGLARTIGPEDQRVRVDQAVDDLDATIKDIRRTIFALGATDASADIQSEVSRLVERASAGRNFKMALEFVGPVRTLVGEHVAPDLLAVLGEALSNVSRHADASAVAVELRVGAEVVLTVTDDGRGLTGSVVESGVANMRDRAVRHGGRLELGPHPDGAGTRLTWAVPVSAPSS